MSRRTFEAFILVVSLLVCLAFLAPMAHCQSCVTASQVTLTGTLRASNGLPSSNAIITMAPSQTGFIAGCGVNLQTQTTCATSTDGSVVQTPNPQTPTVNSTSGSGSLPNGVYYTTYAWYDALGHVTLPGPETVTTLSASGSLVVNPPASGVPSTAAGMQVYIGTSSGGETLQGSTTGTASFVQSTALTSGAALPTVNNTVCVATANDSIWPTGTGYIVSMTDSVGNGIPGFPMQWQLMGAGSTINLSNGLPYYHGVVTYPVPVLTAPQNHGAQSITGPLSLSGYNLTNVGRIGIDTPTPGYGLDAAGSGINGVVNADTGFLINGNAGTSGQCLASDGTYLDTLVNCVTSIPQLFYQIITNTTGAAGAVTQRSYIGVGPGTGLVATDHPAVGSQVARTSLQVNTVNSNALSSDPALVPTSTAGTPGNCMQWDSFGGAADAGVGCTIATPRTVAPCSAPSAASCVGEYQIQGDGTITNWVHVVQQANDNTYDSITFPHAFTTTMYYPVCSMYRPGGNPGPVGVQQVSTTAFGLLNNTGGTGTIPDFFCTITGH